MERQQWRMKRAITDFMAKQEKEEKEASEKKAPQGKYLRYWLRLAEEQGLDYYGMKRGDRKKWKFKMNQLQQKEKAKMVTTSEQDAKKYWKRIEGKNKRRAERVHKKIEEKKENLDWSNKEEREEVKKLKKQEATSKSMASLMNVRASDPKKWSDKNIPENYFKEYVLEFEKQETKMVNLDVCLVVRAENLMAMEGKDEMSIKGDIRVKDIKLLQAFGKSGPEIWLNDTLVDAYMELISKKYEHVKTFACFFYTTLIAHGEIETFRRYRRSIKTIFDYKIVMVPIIRERHWTLVSVDWNKKTISHYDSLFEPKDEILYKIKKMLAYVASMTDKVRKLQGLSIKYPLYGKQKNGHDCGVFTCQYARTIAKNELTSFGQQDMAYFRRRMALELIGGLLLD